MSKTITILNIASDFCATPAGRFYCDGPFSGEALREELIVPVLEQADEIVIDFSGIAGAGSSVLEECFGGLFREYNGRPPFQKVTAERIRFETPVNDENHFYDDIAMSYMKEACELISE